MKIPTILLTTLILAVIIGGVLTTQKDNIGATPAISVYQGGTGTTTAPSAGQILQGNASGKYDLVATSTLNIPSSDSTTNWNTAYGWGNHAGLYPTYAIGSTTYVALGNSSTTNLTVSGDTYIGTVKTGTWNGTKIDNAYIASSTEYLSDIGWNGSLVANASTTNLTVATQLYAGALNLTGHTTFVTASGTAITLTGNIYDSISSGGDYGDVLLSTGTSTLWVATSTLGITAAIPDPLTVTQLNATNASTTNLTASGTINLNTGYSGGIYIKENGYVGIGNIDPAYKLSVYNGNIYSHDGIISAANINLGGDILSADGMTYFDFNKSGTCVNHFDVQPSTTGNNPIFSSDGDDSNINLELSAKGTGYVYINDALNVSGQTTFTTASGTAITATNFYGNLTGTASNTDIKTITASTTFLSVLDTFYSSTITPIADSLYSFGTTAIRWANAFFDSLTSAVAIIETRLNIPNGASMVTDTAGDIAIDTTSDQLRFKGTATTTLVGFQSQSITIASSTWNADKGTSGTSTIPVGIATANETWSTIACFTDTATTSAQFGYGTSTVTYMSQIIAGPASYNVTPVTVSTNNAILANLPRWVKVGSFTGTPNYLTCTVKKSYDAD